MAGAVQGNLQTEVSVVRNPRVVMPRGASPAGAEMAHPAAKAACGRVEPFARDDPGSLVFADDGGGEI